MKHYMQFDESAGGGMHNELQRIGRVSRQRPLADGFTLVELLITLTVAGILLALAVPAFTGMLERNRLKAAVESLYADLQRARSEAIRVNRSLKVDFYVAEGDAMDWCYGFRTDGEVCDCRDATDEGDGDATYCRAARVTAPDVAKDIGITLDLSPVGCLADTICIDPRFGTSSSGNALFTSASGYSAKIVTTSTGRMRLCSDPGDGHLPGYSTC